MAALENVGNRLLESALDRWHSRSGLALAIGAIVALGIAVFSGIDISNVSRIEWGIIGFVVAGACLLWGFTSVPHAKRNTVGFGVAIEFEQSEPAKELRADFIGTLRTLLNASQHLRRGFTFIEFPERISRRLSSEADGIRLMRRSHVSFLIHGRARVRRLPRGESHVLDLSWIVSHRTIAKDQSAKFASDASQLFPSRVVFDTTGAMIGAEFAAHHIDAVGRYIIGTASAISGDLDYAEQLLIDAERRFRAFVKQAEGADLSVMLDRVRRRIGEVYSIRLAQLAFDYKLKRTEDLLEQMERVVHRLRVYWPDDYNGHLAAALCAFMHRRDLDAAKAELDACRGQTDGTWMYSEAFVIAYGGDLDGAYRMYRRAFESPLRDQTIPIECEEFIQIVLDQEPDRKWLYYCLGLINHRAKNDLVAARSDFTTFIDGVDQKKFKRHIQIARNWINEIDAVLAATNQPSSALGLRSEV